MIITRESHIDHKGLTFGHLKFLFEKFADREGFFKETFTMPDSLPALPCGLYGPLMGDAPVPEKVVAYAVRGERTWRSRFIDKPLRETRVVTVIAGPDSHGNKCVLYTVYGGPEAPREPGDPALSSSTHAEESESFWAQHALSQDS